MPDPDSARDIKAAGGVVWQQGQDGPEVLLVHRPRYDDWSLPKGKLDAGESWEQGAVREVREETGIEARLGPWLIDVSYPHSGRRKVVRYWAMQPVSDGGFTPGHEVDELAWLPVPAARERLSYPHDRSVLDAFTAVPLDP